MKKVFLRPIKLFLEKDLDLRDISLLRKMKIMTARPEIC